jgi:hypothetical protein
MTGKDHAARAGYRHGPGLGRSLPGLAAVNEPEYLPQRHRRPLPAARQIYPRYVTEDLIIACCGHAA